MSGSVLTPALMTAWANAIRSAVKIVMKIRTAETTSLFVANAWRLSGNGILLSEVKGTEPGKRSPYSAPRVHRLQRY